MHLKSDHHGIVLLVQPVVVSFLDVPQIAAYHNKLLFGEFELRETNLNENVVPCEALLHI